MTYQVKWKALWKSLTVYMSVTIIVTVSAILLFRYLNSGFDYTETFRHISIQGFAGLLLGCWVFSGVFALLISVWFKIAHITIDNGYIQGRNYWGRKKAIPLNKLQSLDSFSCNGIDAVVANGGSSGKVFIYLQTEKLDEIVEILESHLPRQMEA